MKGELTVSEMGRRGGHARARKLSKRRRREISRNASIARWERAKRKRGNGIPGQKNRA